MTPSKISLLRYCPFYPVGPAAAPGAAFAEGMVAALSSLVLAFASQRLTTHPQDSWVRAYSFDRDSSWVKYIFSFQKGLFVCPWPYKEVTALLTDTKTDSDKLTSQSTFILEQLLYIIDIVNSFVVSCPKRM